MIDIEKAKIGDYVELTCTGNEGDVKAKGYIVDKNIWDNRVGIIFYQSEFPLGLFKEVWLSCKSKVNKLRLIENNNFHEDALDFALAIRDFERVKELTERMA